MVMAIFHKAALSGVAAAIAAGAGLVNSAEVAPAPAYGAYANSIDLDIATRHAAGVFDRADLNNDGVLGEDEFTVLAIVTAELALLNGFIAVDVSDGVKVVAAPRRGKEELSSGDKASIKNRAEREFLIAAGDDLRLSKDEFIGANLERFLASDADRNGALSGAELAAYAQAQSRLAFVSS